VTPPPTNDLAASIAIECKQIAAEKNWADATNCADRLAKQDPKMAKALKAQYTQELGNELSKKDLEQAVAKKDLTRARKLLADIEEGSIYRDPAQKLVDDLEDDVVTRYRDEALALKRGNKCAEIDRLVNEAREKGGPKAAAAVQKEKCVVAEQKDCSDKLLDPNNKACKQQFCAKNGSDARCGTGTVAVTPPANCDADALKEEGMQSINLGQHAQALAKFESSLKCRRDAYVIQLCFMEACASSNSPKAKLYYKQLSTAQQAKFAQMCIRNKVDYLP
jgi:hypothetical protein